MSADVDRLLRAIGATGLGYREIRARDERRRAAGGAPIPLVPRPPRRRPRLHRAWRLLVVPASRGAGATTVAANLVLTLPARGLRASAVDLAPSGALSARLPRASACDVAASLDGIARDADVTVIDAPAPAGGLGERVREALAAADEVLLVARAGAGWADARRAGDRLATAAAAPSRWLLNGLDERDAEHRRAHAALLALLGDRLFRAPLHWDPAAGHAALARRAVADDAPWSQLAADLELLADAIAEAATPPALASEVRF